MINSLPSYHDRSAQIARKKNYFEESKHFDYSVIKQDQSFDTGLSMSSIDLDMSQDDM
jgi:hypothetical protein